MKNIILSLSFILPVICHAEPKWELIGVTIKDKQKETLNKIYLDRDSIKNDYNNDYNDIRSFDLKTTTLGGKSTVNNFTIMCSKGYAKSNYYAVSTNEPLKIEKKWGKIFSRNTVFGRSIN